MQHHTAEFTTKLTAIKSRSPATTLQAPSAGFTRRQRPMAQILGPLNTEAANTSQHKSAVATPNLQLPPTPTLKKKISQLFGGKRASPTKSTSTSTPFTPNRAPTQPPQPPPPQTPIEVKSPRANYIREYQGSTANWTTKWYNDQIGRQLQREKIMAVQEAPLKLQVAQQLEASKDVVFERKAVPTLQNPNLMCIPDMPEGLSPENSEFWLWLCENDWMDEEGRIRTAFGREQYMKLKDMEKRYAEITGRKEGVTAGRARRESYGEQELSRRMGSFGLNGACDEIGGTDMSKKAPLEDQVR